MAPLERTITHGDATMTTRAFGAHTPKDLLARASHEIRELQDAVDVFYLIEDEGKHKVGSLAGACAGTLWNVVDWLANSTDPATRSALAKATLTTHDAIRDYVKAKSPEVTLCWELTNGYKHCELTGYTLAASQIDQATLSAVSSLSPNTALAYRFVPKVKTKADANLPALGVYKDALSFWERFFKQLGL
jgi:hypothetical protein